MSVRLYLYGVVGGLLLASLSPAIPDATTLFLLGVLCCLLLPLRSMSARLLGGLLMGVIIGLLDGYSLQQRQLPEACVGERLQVRGTVDSLPEQRAAPWGGTSWRFLFAVEEIEPAHCAGPVSLLLSYYGEETFVPGEQWLLPVKAKRPRGLANPGSGNFAAWYAQQGVHAVGTIASTGAVRLAGGTRSTSDLLQRVRLDLSNRIGEVNRTAAVRQVLRALTIADKSGLGEAVQALFRQFGISHLLVISGLHIGLAATAGFLVARIMLLPMGVGPVARFRLQGCIGLAVAVAYAALAGFTVPTQRAVLMLAVLLVATGLGRPGAAADRLLWAALVVLLVNPLAAIGAGFWLSFLAVAMLLWLAAWRSDRHWLGVLTLGHLYMTVVMLPLGAFYFGQASWVSAPANLLMIPLVGFWVVPLALLAAGLSIIGLPLDLLLWQLAGLPLEWAVTVLQVLSGQRSDQWLLQAGVDLPTLLIALLACAVLCVPGGIRHRLAASLVLLLVCLPEQNVEQEDEPFTRITVLDVGQGTSVVVSRGRRALVYDTGGGKPGGPVLADSVLLPYLREMGITQLDTLVISHADLDHSAGAASLLRTLPVQRVRYGPGEIMPGVRAGKPCAAGESWRWPSGPVFTLLSPALERHPGRNSGSCVLLVQQDGRRFLLAGDVEAPRERALAAYWRGALESDWLLAPHHGSRTSSSWALLKQVSPHTVIASSGYANRFNHPHPLVRRRVGQAGARLLETAQSGALEFRLMEDGRIEYSAWRRQYSRHWL